ncbi:2OG-Fe(II) oxygenase [Caenimonas koreensis]|uniref:2OG-Fe(II) oxygenase n=1 Tax=Caenimonas koreensis TaxID=367474 RepID=UPI0037849FA6
MARASTDLFDLYLQPDFFDPPTCQRVLADLVNAAGEQAAVYGVSEGGVVDERVRKVMRLAPSRATVDFVESRLMQARVAIAAHFRLELAGCEAPQFLRYGEGGHFVAHQDGGTGMLRSHAEQSRKASVVIFLNAPCEDDQAGTYAGGSLVFTEWRANRTNGRFDFRAGAGSLVAFLPDTTHEVTPVTRGERYSIATWYW